MKSCFLFPGQGAQFLGMGKDIFEASKEVRELFELASDAAHKNLKEIIFESDEATLKQTQNTQIAIALTSTACAVALRERGVTAQGVAGFSVGEWPAMAWAGIIKPADMFYLVAQRGRLMDQAASRSGGSTMSAVLGVTADAIEKVIKETGLKQVWLVNYNSPQQSVIAGTEADIAACEEALKASGVRKVIRLKVSGAFHSPIMQSACEEFKAEVEAVNFSAPSLSFFSNVTGGALSDPAQIKKLAVEQIISPVRWTQEEESIKSAGFERVLEMGPGNVLAGLWKAMNYTEPCLPAGKLEEIDAVK